MNDFMQYLKVASGETLKLHRNTIEYMKKGRCDYCSKCVNTTLIKRLGIKVVRNLCEVCCGEYKEDLIELNIDELFAVRIAMENCFNN